MNKPFFALANGQLLINLWICWKKSRVEIWRWCSQLSKFFLSFFHHTQVRHKKISQLSIRFSHFSLSIFISLQSPSDEQYGLTQAGLEEYSRSYYEQNMIYNHQKQSSYAQSEGYHSYVSSSDSTSTPFLDR